MASLEKLDASGGADPARGDGVPRSAGPAPAPRTAEVLSMAERLSADLDNDRPYNAEIERRIEDCEAGRPIGKTYTADEYLEHLKREHGIGALESPE